MNPVFLREKDSILRPDAALCGSGIVVVMRSKESIGHERISFGYDIPSGTMKWEVEKVFSLTIEDGKKEWVGSKNLGKLIGLT